jgi:HlyD family secretion protein
VKLPRSQSENAASSTVILLAFCIVAAVLGGVVYFKPADSDQNSDADYFEVKEGNFIVTIVEGGTLEAVNEISVRNEVKYPTKIVSIVAEGTYVKKGQLLCELDVSEIEDRLDEQKLSVENAGFSVKQATETLNITKSQQDSLIKAAELRVEFAKIDYEKYVDGDWPQLKRDASTQILTAKEKLAIDEDTLLWSQKLAKEGFETEKKVESDKYTALQSNVRLEQAEENLRLLEKYDNPKMLRQYQANLDEAGEELKRVKSQSISKISQSEAELKSSENRFGLQEKKLGDYTEQITAAKIHAPEAGMVVYPFVSFRSSSQAMIEEGASVRPRQEIIKLPDISQMKVTIKVHESHVNQVVAGMGAYVVLDSLPDERFAAHVRKVGLMPDQGSRFSNPDLKVYSTEILIDDKLPEVKPGLSARAEIVITNLLNVIKVPIQAVTTYKNNQVCYVRKGSIAEPVPVEVGLYNSKFIQVQTGLKAGDQILLSPPVDSGEVGLDKAVVEDGDTLPPTRKVEPAPQSKGGKQSSRGQGGAGKAPGGQKKRSRQMSPEMLKRFDKNGNGTIDEDERAAIGAYYRSQGGKSGGKKQ